MPQSPQSDQRGPASEQLHRVAAELRQAYEAKTDAEARLHQAEIWAVQSLLRVVSARCARLGAHLCRVGHFASEIARSLGLDETDVAAVGAGGCLHDIGFLAFSEADLDTANDPIASGEMREHSERGLRFLGEGVHDLDLIVRVQRVILNHHERWDGLGTPGGLHGTEIPVEARIVAVADAYDRLREEARGPAPLSHVDASALLLEGGAEVDPGWFDPDVLTAFARIGPRIGRMCDLISEGRL